MSVVERQIVAVYNQRAGNGQAETIIKHHRQQISGLGQEVVVKDIAQLSTSNLLKLSGKAKQILLAVYAGDGTQANVLSQVFKLIEDGQLDPQQIDLCLVGNKGSGGERVIAKTLGTNNKSMKQIIDQLDQNPQNSRIDLRPHFIESANHSVQPVWWLYGSASGIMAQSLAHIEYLRNNTDYHHLQRIITTAHKILQKFQYAHQIQASLGKESFASQELVYLVPPFMALSRIKFPPSLSPLVLTVNKNGLAQAEFNRQAIVALLSLAILGFTRSQTINTRYLSAQEKLVVYNSREPQVMDSERVSLGSPVTIFQDLKAPSVRVVKLTHSKD